MNAIKKNLQKINTKIREFERRYKRKKDSVSLVAVSKRQSAQRIKDAFLSGQKSFGENYLQEAVLKQEELRDLDIEWHFIGNIQSNKTQEVAQRFDWVHSVSRMKVIERLNRYRPQYKPPLNVLIQLNTSREATKAGAQPNELKDLVENIMVQPRLQLRGLMGLPEPSSSFESKRARIRQIVSLAKPYHPEMDVLSIGTSHDFEAAIAEGATLLRLGTALFGARSSIP
jgi:pyridoxal phosphate enzyme (YggS family)